MWGLWRVSRKGQKPRKFWGFRCRFTIAAVSQLQLLCFHLFLMKIQILGREKQLISQMPLLTGGKEEESLIRGICLIEKSGC